MVWVVISQLQNVYAILYFLEKIIHVLKLTGKSFDLLKLKSYLIRLKDISRYAT